MPPKRPLLIQPDFSFFSPETHPTHESLSQRELEMAIGLHSSIACRNRLIGVKVNGKVDGVGKKNTNGSPIAKEETNMNIDERKNGREQVKNEVGGEDAEETEETPEVPETPPMAPPDPSCLAPTGDISMEDVTRARVDDAEPKDTADLQDHPLAEPYNTNRRASATSANTTSSSVQAVEVDSDGNIIENPRPNLRRGGRKRSAPAEWQSRGRNGRQTGNQAETGKGTATFVGTTHPARSTDPIEVETDASCAPIANLHSRQSMFNMITDDEDEDDQPKAKNPIKRDSCSVKRCEHNLRCLNHLGGMDWVAKDAKEKFFEANGLGPNPCDEWRDPELPVGLRNLGATCYANAFLQVWYRILPFRAGVYSCALTQNFDTPVFQLALTFAGLQMGKKNVYDPTGLVETLKLDKGDQQDASEFSKLFMSLLATEFGKQGDAKLQSLISDQFEGELSYVTTCDTCKKETVRSEKFLELEISLEDKEPLSDRINEILAEETLEGDNQYHCSNCDRKSDATRATRLNVLPPILHFSVMRFVYDAKSGKRKKSKATIKFPPRIDMGQYIAGSDNVEDIFELRGIVEHRGASAHSGHFVSAVFDAELQGWFMCNDETISSTPAKTSIPRAPDSGKSAHSPSIAGGSFDDAMNLDEDPLASNTASNKKRSKQYGKKAMHSATAAQEPKELHSSGNVYMLVYARINSEDTQDSSQALFMSARPSGEVLIELDRVNANHTIEADGYEAKERVMEDRFDAELATRLPIMRKWHAEDKGLFVFLPSLRKWIKNGLVKADPAKITAEIVERTSLPMIPESGGHVNDIAEHSPGLAVTSPISPSLAETAPAAVDPANLEEMNGINKRDPDGDVRADPDLEILEQEEIPHVCIHGAVDPKAWAHVKIVSSTSAAMLQSIGFDFGKMLQSDHVCRICVFSEVQASIAKAERDGVRQYVKKAMSKRRAIADYIISTRWLDAWISETALPQGEALSQLREAVECKHGGAVLEEDRNEAEVQLISEKTFHQIVSVTEDCDVPAMSLLDGACAVCQLDYHEQRSRKAPQILQAEAERVNLGELVEIKTSVPPRPPAHSGVLVSASWIKAWQAFVDKPMSNARPRIDDVNIDLYCLHNQLCMDVDLRADWTTDVVCISEDSRQNLDQLYGEPQKPHILIKRETRASRWKFDYCATCAFDRRSSSTDFDITVYRLLDTEPIKEHLTIISGLVSGDESPQADNVAMHDEMDKSAQGRRLGARDKRETLPSGAVRRMTLRAPPNTIPGLKPNRIHTVKVNKDDKVLSVKKKLALLVQTEPWLQRLYTDAGIELANDVSLSDNFILNGAILLLKAIDPEVVSIESDEDTAPLKRKDGRADGFGGTMLHGRDSAGPLFPDKPGVGKAMATNADEWDNIPAELVLDSIIACSRCTFRNPLGNEICEMCSEALVM